MPEIAAAIATLLGGLLAGFLFAFAVVVMPGLRSLPDRNFLRGFQRVDGVIQRGSPWFFVVWVGSTASLVVAATLALFFRDDATRWVLVGVAIAQVIGVQVPTATINIPLNNRLQALDLDTLDDEAIAEARQAFEPRWNRWNVARTWVAVVVAAALVALGR